MLTIDGSEGEGGGQVLRTALALGALTGTPVTVARIRAGRSNPGLRAQHVVTAEAIAQASGGKLEGARVGSSEVRLVPGPLVGGPVKAETGTAGSTTLIAQALLPLARGIEEPLTLTAWGGTDTKWAPTLEHLRAVLLPLAASAGIRTELLEAVPGFYPKGGGKLRLRIHPAAPPAWTSAEDRGALDEVRVRVGIAGLPDHVAERCAKSAARVLQHAGEKVRTEIVRYETLSPGVVVDAIARYASTVIGANALGEQGVRSEAVGAACGERLLAEMRSQATVDEHAADQLVPLLHGRVGKGFTVREVSGHLRTNLALTARMLDGASVIEERLGGALIRFA